MPDEILSTARPIVSYARICWSLGVEGLVLAGTASSLLTPAAILGHSSDRRLDVDGDDPSEPIRA